MLLTIVMELNERKKIFMKELFHILQKRIIMDILIDFDDCYYNELYSKNKRIYFCMR